MVGPFDAMLDEWRQIIVFVSILSMILGALGTGLVGWFRRRKSL
jgi:NADH:ubiquinone oxidoreductase subunit 2 (subunit N)